MPSPELRQRPGNYLCGLASWHPEWMQRFATTKMFMLVYGLLGTIQAMSYMYFIVTLTTIEKRFKIPSQTTGIILSGNEISQILFSLILSYVGGQRNRPRWIAWGIVFCGLSCYILALPHFIFGPGTDALQLTKEYAMERMSADATAAFALDDANTTHSMPLVTSERLCGSAQIDHECSEVVSIVPLILIFISQFVLGIGNTLYYSLGQTYLDDNTKKTNTPLMLAVAMALRMIGPIVGFFLGFMSLNMFIDPSKTPLIDKKDTRWLGAWWFGWMILGTLMVLFSGLIGLFPKQLPKKHNNNKYNSHMPQVLRNEELQIDEGLPLGRGFSSNVALDTHPTGPPDFPKLKDFPKALLRLLRNRLLIFNITSAIFYILGAAGYMTFLTKYMEVQFHKNAQSATVVVGPVSIIGMVIGLIVSGLVISKKKPRPSKVLLWNVIVGLVYIVGQISYMFMYCPDSVTINDHGKLNLSQTCNANCACEGVPYSPICHEETETTYFSACHAGCNAWNSEDKLYSNCSCLANVLTTTTTITTTVSTTTTTMNYTSDYDTTTEVAETMIPRMVNVLTANSTSASGLEAITTQTLVDRPNTSTTTTPSTSTSTSTTTTTTKVTVPITTTTAAPTRESTVTSTTATASTGADSTTTTTTTTVTTTTTTTSRATTRKSEDLFEYDYDKNDEDYDDSTTLSSLESESLLSRSRRSVEALSENILKPGVCLKDCNRAFWTFAIASLIVNWFGSSGRIGNLLVNYRAVSTEDKSFAQGLSLMMVSLFALIPGPIIFGRIIDSTCLIWTKTCTGNGNCQLYDQTRFRYMVNLLACALTAIGVIFDTLVWYHGRSLDLYGEKETLRMDELQRKYKPITPLLAKRQERS